MAEHRTVLVGGGHAHALALLYLGQRRRLDDGLRLTLVTDRRFTPYSGMLPGHIAGFYTRSEMHIDLAKLAKACGADLVEVPARGLELDRRLLVLADGSTLSFDTLSLNLGITPDTSAIAGAERFAIPVKPISSFLDRFEGLLAEAGAGRRLTEAAVIGGGAAGFELALALRTRLDTGAGGEPCRITLVAGGRLLDGLNERVRDLARQALRRRGVMLVENFRVVDVTHDTISSDDGRTLAADATLISTAARAPAWLGRTGLPLAPDGSIRTTPTLTALGSDAIFAVGDCAVLDHAPRPKAGVFAVRQGPALAANLLRRVRGEALKPFHPQTAFLTLLATGDGRAIAGKGRWFATEGACVWHWKDWIDRRFMRCFPAQD